MTARRLLALALVPMVMTALPIRADAQGMADPASDRVLTLFTNGLGQVWESRPLPPSAGPREVVLDGISNRALAETLRISGAGGNLAVVEMSLNREILTPHALLKRSLGREIGIIKTHPQTGEERIVKATVLALEGGPVLRVGDRIETGMPERLAFPDNVFGLPPRPTLTARIDAGADVRALDLTYLSEGLLWSADYTAVLSPDGSSLDLEAWATLRNETEVSFPTARLQLVAGTVGRVSQGPVPMMKAARGAAMAEGMAADAGMPPMPQREASGELHVYAVSGTVALDAGEQKQVALLRAAAVPAKETLISTGHPQVFGAMRGEAPAEHPVVEVSFANKDLAGTGAGAGAGGLPLPGGLLRVYRERPGSTPLFSGEDRMTDTPAGETARLNIGRAFDVTVRREQTAFNRLDPQGRSAEAAFKITLRNGRERAAQVRLDENIPGDWEVTEASSSHQRAGGQARWVLEVPARGETVLTYKVRVLR